MIVVGLVESDTVISIDNEVAGVYVVALEYHIEYLWLVNSALLHEVDSLVLHNNSVVNVVIELNLHFVLQLSCLVQKFFTFDWLCEIKIVLGQQVELADMSPRIEPVS